MDMEKCENTVVHQDIVSKVEENLPQEEFLYDLAELFKIFGDSTRIRILNMTQSAISHQLRVLKQARLVKYRREGKSIFYSLADGHIQTILDQGFEHITE